MTVVRDSEPQRILPHSLRFLCTCTKGPDGAEGMRQGNCLAQGRLDTSQEPSAAHLIQTQEPWIILYPVRKSCVG
jgi:hypothetical protein